MRIGMGASRWTRMAVPLAIQSDAVTRIDQRRLSTIAKQRNDHQRCVKSESEPNGDATMIGH